MGEFDIDRIVELLDSGEFLWTDLCWTQGMSGWAPLTQLRGAVAAAKAFPPVAAMPVPVASGRRRVPPAPALVSSPQASPSHVSSAGVAGWGWIAGGVTLGAIVGLLTTYLFPNVVTVDRPVDRIVEKPVEVVRTVVKRVEVPAVLSSEQQKAITFYSRFHDFANHKKDSRLFGISNRVKVITDFNGDGMYSVSEANLKVKVESAFRSQGFKILSQGSEEYPYSVVRVVGNVIDSGISPRGAVVGACGIEILQTVTYLNTFDRSEPADVEIKTRDVVLFSHWGSFFFGRTRFNEIADSYVILAEEAAGELRKASDN
jgi:hypothetical protein